MPVQRVEKEEIVDPRYVDQIEAEADEALLRQAFLNAIIRTLFGPRVQIIFIPVRFLQPPPPPQQEQTNEDKIDEVNQRLQTEEAILANE